MKTSHVLLAVGAIAVIGGGYLVYKRLGAIRSAPLSANAPQIRSNPIVNTVKDLLSIGVAGTEAYSAAKTNLGFGQKKAMN